MAGRSRLKDGVAYARLCPAIHVLFAEWVLKTWMPGTSPGMTTFLLAAAARNGFTQMTRRSSNHVLAAVDRHRRAGDSAGLVGGEEQHGAGDFLGLAETVDRDQRQDAFLE